MCFADLLADSELPLGRRDARDARVCVTLAANTVQSTICETTRKHTAPSASWEPPNKRQKLDNSVIGDEASDDLSSTDWSEEPSEEPEIAPVQARTCPECDADLEDAFLPNENDNETTLRATIESLQRQLQRMHKDLDREKLRVAELAYSEQSSTPLLDTDDASERTRWQAIVENMMEKERARMNELLDKRVAKAKEESENASRNSKQEIRDRASIHQQQLAQKDIACKQKLDTQRANHKRQMQEKNLACRKSVEDVKLEMRKKAENSKAELAVCKKKYEKQVEEIKVHTKEENLECKRKFEEEKKAYKEEIRQARQETRSAATEHANKMRQHKADFKKKLSEDKAVIQETVRKLKPEHSNEIKAKEKTIREAHKQAQVYQAQIRAHESRLQTQEQRLVDMLSEVNEYKRIAETKESTLETEVSSYQQSLDSMASNLRNLEGAYAKVKQEMQGARSKEHDQALEDLARWRSRADIYRAEARRLKSQNHDILRAHQEFRNSHQHNLSRISELQDVVQKQVDQLELLDDHQAGSSMSSGHSASGEGCVQVKE